ncbi:hypothetical protein IWQ60_007730, partial [Tieghemiomyces parasiticus]
MKISFALVSAFLVAAVHAAPITQLFHNLVDVDAVVLNDNSNSRRFDQLFHNLIEANVDLLNDNSNS